jgi:hypothetical protein
MVMEFGRVLLGLLIALFHTRLADFLRKQDHELAAVFRQHGVPMPGALPKQAAHSLFFSLGIAVALFGLSRIWLNLH